ncbi:protein PXR1-like [Chenopodium quinoa]|uniref:protein PXR1-like n=1 Tax=Chenopodium quinoa TaxID=63459 RepID=UPI000B792199|nr:protein PXR1-like [Chenopodium quinoa]
MKGTEEEIKQKHQDGEGKECEKVEEKVEEKVKEKKKKDKESKEKGEGDNNHEHSKEKGGGKEKKKKNPEDKKDPSKLKLKLEKIDTKMRDLAAKREEILKSIEEAEKNAVANPNKEDDPDLKQD